MIIDGKGIAETIQQEIKGEVDTIQGRKPCLAVILVGENPASKIYVSRKAKACSDTGILSIRKNFPDSISEEHLIREIESLNHNPDIDGILIQLPLPIHIDSSRIILSISPEKDVDGFHPINVGKMVIGETDGFLPCTPLGIQVMMMRAGIDIYGRNVLIIGRSNIVGKPLASLLVQNAPGGNATVTLAHRLSKEIKEHALRSDVIIVAIGKAGYLTADMVPEGCVVVDVGINKVEDPSSERGYRIVGDVDFENVKEKCSYITPVPGGVGPMTIALLLSNTLKSYRKREAK
jgi:methylenetetrahydrofolate dehydrogenase (NADP+)/methenyltetrahydrofolate cyclohydrolase